MNINTNIQSATSKPKQPDTQKNIYMTIWRWHFYAGILFAPLIIFLAITGAVYLFKPQLENYMYHNLFYVQENEEKIATTDQIFEVKKQYPNAVITSFTPSFEADRTAVVEMKDYGENVSVYVNPYNGEIIGTLYEKDRFMAFVNDMHNGELWGGTFGNRLVELAACWAVILVISGIYLWWPRHKKSIFGTIIPRIRLLKGKRMFWRDIHAVTAFWLSFFIIIQLISGLMWSGVWGNMANKFVAKTGAGSPVGIQPWESHAFPESTIPTKDIADVPWAAENLPVPKSGDGVTPISIENVIETVENEHVHPGYKIVFPQSKTGVYTAFLDPANVYPNRPMPSAQQTLHIDQYNGDILANLGWKDYGTLGKIVTLGIAFHQGEFGFISQLFILALVIGMILIAVTGFIMWWKRRPKGKFGAPPKQEHRKLLKGVAAIVLVLSIFFPLVGLSLIFVFALDWLITKRIPKLKQWIG